MQKLVKMGMKLNPDKDYDKYSLNKMKLKWETLLLLKNWEGSSMEVIN